jgi:hypothetical protein
MLASPRHSCSGAALGPLSWWSSVGHSLLEFGLNVTQGQVSRRMGNTLDFLDQFASSASEGDEHTRKKVQYNTMPYSAMQYNTIQYNTIQYNTM